MANYSTQYIFRVVDKFSKPLDDLKKKVATVSMGFKSLNSRLNTVGNSINRFGSKASKLGGSLSLKLTAPLSLLGYKLIKGAGEWERYEAVLTTMLGSAELATKRLAELEEFAATTPFEIPEVVQLGNQLQALGRYSKENMTLLGDLAAAAGKPIDQVTRAYAKLASGQKGIAVDMFRDLLITNKDWVKYTGKGVAKSGEMLATTEEMMAAIPKILAAKGFSGMMETQSKTIEGLLSNLSDQIGTFIRNIGKDLVKTIDFKALVKDLTEFLGEALKWFTKLSPSTKKWIFYLSIGATILGPIILTLGQLALGLIATKIALFGVGKALFWTIPKFLALKFAAIGASIGFLPLIAIIGAIALVVYAVIYAFQNWDKIVAGFNIKWARFKESLKGSVPQWIQDMYNWIVKIIGALTDLPSLNEWAYNAGASVREGISGAASSFSERLGRGFDRVTGGIFSSSENKSTVDINLNAQQGQVKSARVSGSKGFKPALNIGGGM